MISIGATAFNVIRVLHFNLASDIPYLSFLLAALLARNGSLLYNSSISAALFFLLKMFSIFGWNSSTHLDKRD